MTIEEITDAAAPQQPQMQMPAGLGDPAEAARYAQMMRDNPALAKMSENMLQGMSQEQLDAIVRAHPPCMLHLLMGLQGRLIWKFHRH